MSLLNHDSQGLLPGFGRDEIYPMRSLPTWNSFLPKKSTRTSPIRSFFASQLQLRKCPSAKDKRTDNVHTSCVHRLRQQECNLHRSWVQLLDADWLVSNLLAPQLWLTWPPFSQRIVAFCNFSYHHCLVVRIQKHVRVISTNRPFCRAKNMAVITSLRRGFLLFMEFMDSEIPHSIKFFEQSPN